VFEDQRCVNQLHRFQFNVLFSQVHAMEIQVACSPVSDFLQIVRVQVQSHNALGNAAVDPIESVSPRDSQYRHRGRPATLQSGRE
jgi:hypothetical protein